MPDDRARQDYIDRTVLRLLETVPNAPVEFCCAYAEQLADLIYGRQGGSTPQGLLRGRSPIQTLGDSITKAMREARHA